ncbi:MAG: hypothetical protein ACE5JS_10565 [Nitrospinota bacterium]
MRCRLGILAISVMVVLAVFWASPPSAFAAEKPTGLTFKEIIELKELGFPEKDIRAEITRSGSLSALTEKELIKLKRAGFSKGFLAFLESLRPKKKLTNDDIAAMVRRGVSAGEILKQIGESERAFDASPRALLKLSKEHNVPSGVILAMRATLTEIFNTVEEAIRKGLTREETAESITFIDRLPIPPEYERIAPVVQTRNIERIFDQLKGGEGSSASGGAGAP